MRKLILVAWACALILTAVASASASDLTAQQVFDRLKALEGTWQGEPEGKGAEAEAEAAASGPVTHEIEVSAAGTVVMETMGPGTDHEMINMYHLDGDDLLVTHYCAGGNQPRMRLDFAKSTADAFVFAFDGGTNLGPDTDHYIGSAAIQIIDENHVESIWHGYSGDEQVATMTFHLQRSE